jgi:heavy metal sensor kinase
VTLFGLRESLRYTLHEESDVLLKDDAYEVVLAVERFYPDQDEIANEMDLKARGHSDRGLFVQLIDEQGRIVISRGDLPDLSKVMLPKSPEPLLSNVGGDRLVQRRVDKAGIPPYTVRVGASLANVDAEMETLTQAMLAAFVVILFVAPLSGYLLAGRATRPLGRIISTAGRLRPSHMEERLPIRGTQDELDQLSLTINRFLDLLRDYLERNREFVANAAHELRSPLAALQSSVEVALNSERTVGEYQDLLGEITDECGQLRVLVNQLLLLAETDASTRPLEVKPVAFDKLVERSADMFQGAADERGISLRVTSPNRIFVLANADRLRQVINNLIDNSIKFTPHGGRVSVVIHSDFIANQVVMTVTDNGKGINPDDLPHVFERFYRGDKSRQREDLTHGSGLGLSICHSIIQAHGGTIQVASDPGRGATFTVMLPLYLTDDDTPADAARVPLSHGQ